MTESKTIKIVLQFREDLKLSKSFLKTFVPSFAAKDRVEYGEVVSKYYEDFTKFVTGEAPLNLSNTKLKVGKTTSTPKNSKTLKNQAIRLLEGLKQLDSKLIYAFHLNDLDTFLGLFNRIKEYNPKTDTGEEFKYRNFHNFFIIQFDLPPCEYCEQQYEINFIKKVAEMLLFLAPFLPENKKSKTHLLEVLYYKQPAVLTEAKQPESNVELDTASNKNYEARHKNTLTPSIKSGHLDKMGILQSQNEAEGEGVTIVDIEFGCYFGHSALSDCNDTQQVFPKWEESHEKPRTMMPHLVEQELYRYGSISDEVKHGTAVLGILKQKAAAGIVPKINFALSSPLTSITANGNESEKSEENAVLAAIKYLQKSPGDIILVEISNCNGHPLETEPLVNFLFQVAYQLNIIVLETAGNDANDIAGLTPKRFLSEEWISKYKPLLCQYDTEIIRILDSLEPKNYSKQQSGAILIGAAHYNANSQSYEKLTSSNYDSSSAVAQIFAPGENIETIDFDYKNPTVKLQNRTNFGSTSAAGAIIAGMAASLQATARKSNKNLTPSEMFHYLNEGEVVYLDNNRNKRMGILPKLNDIEAKLLQKLKSVSPLNQPIIMQDTTEKPAKKCHEEYGLSKTNLNVIKPLREKFKKHYNKPEFVQGCFVSHLQLYNMVKSLEENGKDGLLLNFGAEANEDGEISQLHIIAAEIKFTNCDAPAERDQYKYLKDEIGQVYVSKNPQQTEPPVMTSPPIPPLD